MINLLNLLYGSIENSNTYLSNIKFYSLERALIRSFSNFFLPIYFKLTSNNKLNKLKHKEKDSKRIIVSLTSFPKRINRLWLVIETILRQSIKPDTIILWLSKEQFSTLDSLPNNLKKMRKRGLEIILKEGDLRSHKKYYYAFQEYPHDIIITVDDDIFYPTYMIESLINYHQQYPHSIICRYALEISWNNEGNLQNYNEWDKKKNESLPSYRYFFGSGGGTLFPVSSLYKDVLNKDLFMDICPLADDVWLNCMCRLAHTKVLVSSRSSSILPIIYKNNIDLFSVNGSKNMNDVQIDKLRIFCLNHYNIDPFKIE